MMIYNEEERISDFKNIKSKEDLLKSLNISNNKYNYLIYNKQNLYNSFYIQKRNGEKRKILSPCFELKKIQRDLNIIIQNNYELNDSIVHGFVQGKSIVTNARVHDGATYVLNIDLKDFFGTIHFGRVRGMFLSLPFAFSNYIATNLAKVICYEKKLPQGAPTSPTIANIICYKMDRELNHFCSMHKCKYSRYADDITISSKSLNFPEKIAYFNENNEVVIGVKLGEIISAQGFVVNNSKTKFNALRNRQEITGLIVNEKINVKKVYLKKVRALLNNINKYDFYIEGCKYFRKNESIDFSNKNLIVNKFKKVIEGKLEFLRMIKGEDNLVYIKYADIYNGIVGFERFDVDHGKEIVEFAKNRTFPIYSYDYMNGTSQGSCFMTKSYGMITSTHIFINKDAFYKIDDFNNIKKLEKFDFIEQGGKVFYLLDHLCKQRIFLPIITKKNIATDIINFEYIHSQKEFEVNTSYVPKEGETVFLIGYGNFSSYQKTSINYIKACVTGTDEFCKRGYYCIDKKIYHGMSGGPVLNLNREVIGIIYAGAEIESYYLGKNNGFIPISAVLSL